MQINLNERKGVQVTYFPDNQPHVELHGVFCCEEVEVSVSIDSAARLLELAMLSNCLDSKFCTKDLLIIHYLLGARYDRHMHEDMGDSFDLKVIADIINSLGFKKVQILDPHSNVSLALINNSEEINNKCLVTEYEIADTVVICPDAGAEKKVFNYASWNRNLTGEVAYCKKTRDKEGKIDLTVLNPDLCKDRNCIIIDDICDGGGTFLKIAEQVAPKHLTLMVTHGIFSKGMEIMEKSFDLIMTTDSYCRYDDKLWNKLIVYKLNDILS